MTDPDLLIGQCCGYDLIYGFASCVTLVATPRFGVPGCDGANYRSFVLVRQDCPAEDLEGLRGGVCAINSFNSHSGTNALRGLVAPLCRNGGFFSGVEVTGGHLSSLALLKTGRVDTMAMDCVLHALLARHRPQALAGTRTLCQSESVPAPPFITSSSNDHGLVAKLRAALDSAFRDEASADARTALMLAGIEQVPLQDYARILDVERTTLHHGYKELHATTPVRSA
ncbi:MAG: PhnD/SsuA/transferrin family substrate-binding protein [Hyphomicrobiales bacterium]|nr:PhnD/SsuA/transferrin family substrate-binding protein [Hyphomicrobiales bacterium]